VRVSLAALAVLALLAGCGSQRNTLGRLWHGSGQAVVLIPGTSDYQAGDVRVSFLVVADDGQAINRPTAEVWVARGQKATPFARTTARLERVGVPGAPDAAENQSLYVAHVRIPRPGHYWLLARPVGGSVHIGGVRDFDVRTHPAAPSVGSKAIASQTPTLANTALRLLTTRVPPDRALLRYSVASSLRAGVPFVLVFATPRFCTSRTCGPVVDVVDAARRHFAHTRIRFIHVEIYKDNNPTKGENRWVRQWHLPTEPWIFLVGRDGRIKARFEGAVSLGELEAAVRRSLVQARPATR
jgi:hypothetical protein